MDIKNVDLYISNQLSRIKPTMTNKEQMAQLNCVYAVLECQGLTRGEIQSKIESTIKKQIENLNSKVIQQANELE